MVTNFTKQFESFYLEKTFECPVKVRAFSLKKSSRFKNQIPDL